MRKEMNDTELSEERVIASASRQLQTIVNNVPEAIITINTEGKIVSFNKAAEEIFKTKKEDILFKDLNILIPERYHERHKKAIGDTLISESPSILGKQLEVVAKRSGEEFPVELSITKWSDGTETYFTTFIRDISERKRLEHLLIKAKKEAETYLNVAGVMLVVIGPDERVKMINRKGAEILEAETDEIVGKNWFDNFIPEDIRDQIRGVFNQILSGDLGPYRFHENHVITKKGKKRLIRWYTALLRDNSGTPIGTLSSGEDITEQKEMEEELIKKHEEMLLLFKEVEKAKKEWEVTLDCLNEIIILTDSQGRIKRCNKKLSEITGLSYNEIINRDWEVLLKDAGFDTGMLYNQFVELFHKPTGRTFSLNSYCFFNKEVKTDISTIITVHETTELNRLSEELREKNRELEEALRELKWTQSQMVQHEKMASIGQLAAGVAHEINNPMGFISSNLTTLSKYIEKITEYLNTLSKEIPLDMADQIRELEKKLKIDYIIEDIHDLIKESLEGAERVKKIVRDLKSFSRVDEADEKLADINECIESTLNIVWNELKYKATVKKEYGEIPPTYCNPQQLNQVFMNLLVNAAHAIEKQGEISIKTWHENGYIYASISDTGCGIPEEVKNRIFEPFFTTKEVGKGTGLGLSIAYDIVVKKHNGEITVDSELGKGTTFTIKIPVQDKPSQNS